MGLLPQCNQAGVAGMTLPMARDLADFGIRVMTVAPGAMDTPLMRMSSPKVIEGVAKGIPFPQRMGR